MYLMVSVPSVSTGMPCGSLPISFLYDLFHVAWYLGLARRCWYSIISSISSLCTPTSASLRKRLPVAYLAVILFPLMLIIHSMVSWVMVCNFLLWVLCARDKLGYSALLCDSVDTLVGAIVSLTLVDGVSVVCSTLGSDIPCWLLFLFVIACCGSRMCDPAKICFSRFKYASFVVPMD